MYKKRKVNGFTLVELIVVIAIVGVLAAVLTVSIVRYMQDSRESQALADARNISNSTQRLIFSKPSGKEIKSAIKAGNGVCSFVYDGTGSGGKSAAVVEILDELGDENYKSGFVVFINGTGADEPAITVYVYALTPSDANSASRDVKPDGCYPEGSYTE